MRFEDDDWQGAHTRGRGRDAPGNALCDLLMDAGFEPLGPSATVDRALRFVATSTLDAALLDIRLLDGRSFPWLMLSETAAFRSSS
jgi:hypothetical protein